MEMNIMGVRGNAKDIKGLLALASALEKKHSATVQLFRADRVFGREHLESAAEKAVRSFGAGRGMARTLGMEILLYAAAERQTSEALRKLGIAEGTDEMALVILGPVSPEDVLPELGLERDDSVLEPEGKDYSVFGISPDEIDCIGEAGIPELVLERVALSETER